MPRIAYTIARYPKIGFREKVEDRKSTRLNSSHDQISYAVFCLKKKNRCSDPGRHGSLDGLRAGHAPGEGDLHAAEIPVESGELAPRSRGVQRGAAARSGRPGPL